MASTSNDAAAKMKEIETNLEATKRRQAELEEDLRRSKEEADKLSRTLNGIERFMPEKLTNEKMPATYRKCFEMASYETDDGSWETDEEWFNEYEDEKEREALKDRWNKLCGRKQDAVEALAKTEAAEAKTKWTQRIAELDSRIDNLRQKRQKEMERRRKRKEIEELHGFTDAFDDSDDESERANEEDGGLDDYSSVDESGQEKKIWFARSEDRRKHRMTKSEAEKIKADLMKRAAPARENLRQVTDKMKKSKEEVAAVKKEIAGLRKAKAIAVMELKGKKKQPYYEEESSDSSLSEDDHADDDSSADDFYY